MRSDLLLKIADELDAFVPNDEVEFDMGKWLEVFPLAKPCGTVCCAIGLAVLKIPEVADLLGYDKGIRYFTPRVFVSENVEGRTLTTEEYDYAAIKIAFGLSNMGDASFLFSPMSYDSRHDPKIVADRIRQFVKEHTDETTV